jgi:hypothetical protein
VTDILLASEDITVLGPPETVELLLDIGPTGQRGSKYFVGVGNPNTLTSNDQIFSQQLFLNDMYINTSPGGEYGYMYQYVSEPGGNTWISVLAVNPVIYSENHLTEFKTTDPGAGRITIPISQIVITSATTLTANNFNIQYEIQHNNPTASSISGVSVESSGGYDNLLIDIEAIQYASSAWTPLGTETDLEVKIHVFITMVGI